MSGHAKLAVRAWADGGRVEEGPLVYQNPSPPPSHPLFSSVSSPSRTFLALSLHPAVHVGSGRQMGG